MNLLQNDPYWKAAAEVLMAKAGTGQCVVGPREFCSMFPHLVPYELALALRPFSQARAVLVHKGLLNEMPFEFLRELAVEWHPVYANEVFVLFLPEPSGDRVQQDHLLAFRERFHELEAEEKLRHEQVLRLPRGLTVVLKDSGAKEDLDAAINRMSVWGMPLRVATLQGLPLEQREVSGMLRGVHGGERFSGALRSAVEAGLQEDAAEWVSVLDVPAVPRIDFVTALARFQHPQLRPWLSGYLEPGSVPAPVGVREGYQTVLTRQKSLGHLHGHREAWYARWGWSGRMREMVGLRPPVLVLPGLVEMDAIRP